jgi:1-acyl-sn-glycerol-3-phosphate acyltransferase
MRERHRDGSTSGLFWAAATPAFVDAVRRHNRRIGTTLHALVSKFWSVYLVGPLVGLLARALLRIRIVHANRLDEAGGAVILAARHFFEWDPFLTYYTVLWPKALACPRLSPTTFAGQYWMRTRLRRVLSWLFGIMGVIRGQGSRQTAIERAAEMISAGRREVFGIFPTGPIGRRREYQVKSGVGYLALRAPEVPVIPVAVTGVQQLTLGAVLRLARPEVTIVLGEPIRACEVEGATEEERVAAICTHVAASWRIEEARVSGVALAPESVRLPLPLVLD